MELLERTYLGNSIRSYSIALGIVLVTVLATYLITSVLHRRMDRVASRTSTGVDDLVVDVLGATSLNLVALASLWIGSLALDLSAARDAQLERVAIIALFLQLGIWGGAAVRGTALRLRQRKVSAGELGSVGLIGMMALLGRVAVWVIVLLLILDNLEVDITALVAGLGIGGIAIALAAQNILGDLFASISIIFDRPFSVGETISVGELTGTVEQIGLKTTRVRSLNGEELILPNGDLLASRIKNYQRMEERRVLASIGVTYDTPPEQLAALPGVLRAAVELEEAARFDRAHLKGFGDSALLFELVYFMRTADHAVYMDVQQRINLRIIEAFAARRIAFAFPSRTVYQRASEPAPPLAARE